MSKACSICGGLVAAGNEVLGYGGPTCNGMHNNGPVMSKLTQPKVTRTATYTSTWTVITRTRKEMIEDYKEMLAKTSRWDFIRRLLLKRIIRVISKQKDLK